jgi:hypothetical protein
LGVGFAHEELLPENRTRLLSLCVLSICVLWQGEAERVTGKPA